MRRPRFRRWARAELLRISGLQAFSLRKLAALAQSESRDDLAPTLLLYAHESDCAERLLALLHSPSLKDEFSLVEHHLGKRSIERLALRGAPLMSLPNRYRSVLENYARAYHAPETMESEKRALQASAHEAMLRTGISPAQIAKLLNLDPSNTHAFLVRGETQRFTLETARKIAHSFDAFVIDSVDN